MNMTVNEIIQRARSLVGVPFRAQGRNPLTGLDCVGVVLWCFAIPARFVRRDYRLRGAHLGEIEAALSIWFNRTGSTRGRAGDVMLFVLSRDQNHLAINCGHTFVHADASLRRVVETPIAGSWPLAATFCCRSLEQPD